SRTQGKAEGECPLCRNRSCPSRTAKASSKCAWNRSAVLAPTLRERFSPKPGCCTPGSTVQTSHRTGQRKRDLPSKVLFVLATPVAPFATQHRWNVPTYSGYFMNPCLLRGRA